MGDGENILDMENTTNALLSEAIRAGKSSVRSAERAAQQSTQENKNVDVGEESIKETEKVVKQTSRTVEHVAKAFGRDLDGWGKGVSK